jgi:predicted PurR-regulated permease PerM
MAEPDTTAKSSWLLTLASIATVIAALYLAKQVLVPLTLAVMLSFLLSPVCDWLERWRLGRIPAVLVTALLGFLVLGMVVWTVAIQMTHLGPKIPAYQRNIEAKLNSVNEYAVVALSKVIRTTQGTDQNLAPSKQANQGQETNDRPYSVRVISPPASPMQVLGGMFSSTSRSSKSTTRYSSRYWRWPRRIGNLAS